MKYFGMSLTDANNVQEAVWRRDDNRNAPARTVLCLIANGWQSTLSALYTKDEAYVRTVISESQISFMEYDSLPRLQEQPSSTRLINLLNIRS